jgi:hypothetical protein
MSGSAGPSRITRSVAATVARLPCMGQSSERSKSCASSRSTACCSAWTSGSASPPPPGATGTPKMPSSSRSMSGSLVGTPWSARPSYMNMDTPSYVGAGSPP